MAKASGVLNGNFRNGDYLQFSRIELDKKTEVITCVICGQEVESQPMKKDTCYNCYRDSLTSEIKADAEWLGTQVIITGGEVLEIGEQTGSSDIPF